jgi:hypothetical protein
MYFPYLYGRQAELSAVRCCSTDFGKPQKIYPVIEPAVPASKGLIKTLVKLKADQAAAYVIVNPSLYKLSDAASQAQWATDVALYVADPQLVRPTLKERAATTASDIASFVAAHPGRALGLVLGSERISGPNVASAIGTNNVMVFLLPGVDALSYAAAVGAHRIVSVRDNFTQQTRNADYHGDEWFTNQHQTFAAAGQPGYGDFTVLPAAFNAGGGPIGAAAFHLTFKDPSTQEFRIQHFVSDEVQQYVSTGPVKLLEAIAHLQAQINATPHRFESSPALTSYLSQLSTGNATSPANNKSLQIQHHLFAVARHLGI